MFSLSLLRAIYPIEVDKAQLPEYLQALERRGLLVPKPARRRGHLPVQARADAGGRHNLLPFAQRQQLHQAVAEHFERAPGSKLELYYPLLAHHWYRVVASSALVPGGGGGRASSSIGRAVLYLQRAGEQAIRNDAGQEAVQHYSHAIELLRHLPESPERVEQEIGLQIGLGNAQVATLGFGSTTRSSRRSRGPASCAARSATRATCSRCCSAWWQHYVVRAQLDVAASFAEQMLMFARAPAPARAAAGVAPRARHRSCSTRATSNARAPTSSARSSSTPRLRPQPRPPLPSTTRGSPRWRSCR